MATGPGYSLSLADLKAACTGTFRERFYNCIKILGIQEVRFLASVGIDPAVLPQRAGSQPLVPLIHIAGWHQPFVRDMVVTPCLPPWSQFFDPQDLRDALVDPGSALAARQACGHKAVFEIVWSQALRPDVLVRGHAFDSTPLAGFDSGGSGFSVQIPDGQGSLSAQGAVGFDFEFGYRLAKDHFRAKLPIECHQYAVMETFGPHQDNAFLKMYCGAFMP